MQSYPCAKPDDTEALFSALSGYNTKLYHDPLTDMYNRRYYEEIVRGMKGPIGVALMDLDDFKVYNLSLIHISEPTRRTPISYAVFCLKKKKKKQKNKKKNRKRYVSLITLSKQHK